MEFGWDLGWKEGVKEKLSVVEGILAHSHFLFSHKYRESANPQRIKEAHRRILMLNHPDTGGSTYLASKINEVRKKEEGEGWGGRTGAE